MTCTGADLALQAFEDADTFYVFICPQCARVVQRRADSYAVEILVDEGVRIETDVPAEAREPHVGEPISPDDILAFHELLQQPEWFRAVLR